MVKLINVKDYFSKIKTSCLFEFFFIFKPWLKCKPKYSFVLIFCREEEDCVRLPTRLTRNKQFVLHST